ncbi:MAG: ATP-dependent DNA helicase RecG [Ardenticatenaceae bacterium]|nr:ATP-dependent DNA helicase RecG [Ardenticatenaceae bacterium]
MQRIFKRLERVLNLEVKQGYKNKAVVGGIRQFAVYWVEQAREAAVDELDQAFVEQAVDLLMEYGRLPGTEARAKAVQTLLDGLQKREGRVGQTVPQPEPDKPAKRERRKPQPKQTAVQKPVETPPPAQPADEEADDEDEQVEEIPPARPQEPTTEPDPAGLAQSVTALHGVGPAIAERLSKLGAETIDDLLTIFPRRYDDYTLLKPINQLRYGDQVTVIGTIWETRARRTRTNQVMVQTVVSDGTGSIQATWFNQPWLPDKLKAGMQIVLSGKIDQFLGRLVMPSPDWEALELDPLRTRRIVPVYPLTQGLNGNKMREIMRTAVSQWAQRIPEPLPRSVRTSQNLYSLPQAVEQIHFPDSQASLHHARRRLMFDELFLLQLGMLGKRQTWQENTGIPLQIPDDALQPFYDALPFSLTAAQQRVIGEIQADLTRPVPMNRLLQGDVGAGKTIVAAAAMLTAVQAGTQAALMAPTEILAEQHYRGLSRQLEPLGVTMALLIGGTPAAEKEAIYAGLTSGEIQIVIGTHALIQEGVTFNNLTLAVIDEQHRFGVDQRGALRSKGAETADGQLYPHVLVMSATPIPRTLALSLYGDLELSILDEMPPGRQEIKTRWLRPTERERAYAFLRRQIEAGRQAYVIYPLVEESDKIDEKAAVEEYERLQKQVFPELSVGLVHGRLRPDEKEAAMRAFYKGETQILVATSVIEVGVDVPNATLILIEGANRFGLAQLHQFRGRVGRGEHQSYCILVADSSSADAEERLKALEQTNDGFVLAEKDLEIRGPGEFFGRRQSGLPELQLASLLDMEMVETARAEAQKLFAADPALEQSEHQLLREQVGRFWEHAGDVS